VAIIPSGTAYETLTPEAICVIDLEGKRVDGPAGALLGGSHAHARLPEHRCCRAGAHHPLYASTLSVLVDELPAVHYLIALLGGPVRVAPYARYGSPELAEYSVRTMDGRYAVILQNHDATTWSENLARAYTRSVYLEWLCRLYYQARLLGEPHLLSAQEISAVGDLLRTYGQRDAD
jgi:L-fuculose-phosphate aldolase